jgi:adenylosuccinate synthase
MKELALRDSPRGTIGTGVGQAARMRDTHPELALFARDLTFPDLRHRLYAIQRFMQQSLAPLFEGDFLPADEELVRSEKALLFDDKLVEWTYREFETMRHLCNITTEEYFAETILGREGIAVVESSHGILTDTYTGFHPHTSALRTLPSFARGMLEDASYDGQIVSLGIHRAYQIRHGAGPMVTHDSLMADRLLPGSHKEDNRYQGTIRVGPLDLVALRYALAASGPDAYDGLAITWFDQVQKLGSWSYCNQYQCTGEEMFTDAKTIRVQKGEDEAQLQHLSKLTDTLTQCVPEIHTVPLPEGASRDELYQLCADTLLKHLGVPVRMISFGPTEQDKVCK